MALSYSSLHTCQNRKKIVKKRKKEAANTLSHMQAKNFFKNIEQIPKMKAETQSKKKETISFLAHPTPKQRRQTALVIPLFRVFEIFFSFSRCFLNGFMCCSSRSSILHLQQSGLIVCWLIQTHMHLCMCAGKGVILHQQCTVAYNEKYLALNLKSVFETQSCSFKIPKNPET